MPIDLHPFRQRTLRARASIEGVGLHSGTKVSLTLCPASPDSGILFERTDLSPRAEIPARAEFVVDTRLNTSLGRDGHKIATVEHVLAALAGCGIDNARIEVEGPEVPIMDGSANPFVQLIRQAGVLEQKTVRRYLLIKKPIEVRDGDKLARFVPAQCFSMSYVIDFQHPLITDQAHRLVLTEKTFQKEIAGARTFGFKRDVERLHAAGLARGGSLSNAVVVDDFNILNPEGLRFPDEFVRHKILDAVGDLSLLGMPVIGHFEAVKAGHALNHALVMVALTELGASEVVRPREERELSALHERVPRFAGFEIA